MPIKAIIMDGQSGRTPAVTPSSGLSVSADPVPPRLPLRTRPFVDFMRNTAGSEDMQGVGTVAAPLTYNVLAPADGDLIIQRVVITIADAGASLNEFGNIGSALTNGCIFQYRSANGISVIDPGLTTNFDFVRLAQGQPAFGDAAGAFRASNVIGTSEGYLPSVDMTMFAPGGLFLTQNTLEALEMVIQDTTTGVDLFTARVFGYVNLS